MYDDSIDFYSHYIFALIDSREEIWYNSMFIEIKNLLNELSNELKIELNLKSKYITTDYERALMNSAKSNISPEFLKGSLFHLSNVYGEELERMG